MRSELTLAQTIDRAQRLLVEHRFAENLEFLEAAVARFPNDPELRLLYGTCLMETRPDDVAEQLVQAIRLDVNDAVRLTRAAGLLLTLGEVDAASSFVARALDLTHDGFVLEADLINLSGRLAAIKGDDEVAEEALREAVALDPSGESFVLDLARFLAERQRVSEAIAVIDASISRVRERHQLLRLRLDLESDQPPT
jgi:Flp pilus assembly protein TadD